MIIKAVKFRKDGFYSQPFAFGGEETLEKKLFWSIPDFPRELPRKHPMKQVLPIPVKIFAPIWTHSTRLATKPNK